jgi:vancomycin resistance protein YoaR
VARNVQLAGVDIGGLTEDELAGPVGDVASDFSATPVELAVGDTTYRTTASDIGLMVDEEETAASALEVGESSFVLARPFGWAMSLFSERRAPLQLRVNAELVASKVVELEGDDRTAPIEPTIKPTEDGFEVVAGKPGRGIDAPTVANRLPGAAASGDEPVVVSVQPGKIEPRFTDSAAGQLASEADDITTEPLVVHVGGATATVEPPMLRSWFSTMATTDGLGLTIDERVALPDLRRLFRSLDGGPVDASFVVEGGQVRLLAGKDGVVCCTPESTTKVLEALQAGDHELELNTTNGPPELTTDEAQALGIKEEIGQPDAFGPTTRHKGGEPRVTNIHKIADIVRGHVILPGETFSVNSFVGKRTAAKGFVEAGVIYKGVFEHDIGGGVSQFATTTFNAALYAGLDFGEYQSHSIFIDRYPKGHEATISYPHPDLEIKNTSPYGVLLWPTYTATSITVHLYSTKLATVELSGPTSRPQGSCTRWTTTRVRSYPDGSKKTDTVFAVYRPGEGINC